MRKILALVTAMAISAMPFAAYADEITDDAVLSDEAIGTMGEEGRGDLIEGLEGVSANLDEESEEGRGDLIDDEFVDDEEGRGDLIDNEFAADPDEGRGDLIDDEFAEDPDEGRGDLIDDYGDFDDNIQDVINGVLENFHPRFLLNEVIDFGETGNCWVGSYGVGALKVGGQMRVEFDGYGTTEFGEDYVSLILASIDHSGVARLNIKLMDQDVLDASANFTRFNNLIKQGVVPIGIELAEATLIDASDYEGIDLDEDTIISDGPTVLYEFRVVYGAEVMFDLNGGVAADRARTISPWTVDVMTIEDGVPILGQAYEGLHGLAAPTRAGHTFGGWYVVDWEDGDLVPYEYANPYTYDGFTNVSYSEYDNTLHIILQAAWLPDDVVATAATNQLFRVGDALNLSGYFSPDGMIVLTDDTGELRFADGRMLFNNITTAPTADRPTYVAQFSANIWDEYGFEFTQLYFYASDDNWVDPIEFTGIDVITGDGTIEKPFRLALTTDEICQVSMFLDGELIFVWNLRSGMPLLSEQEIVDLVEADLYPEFYTDTTYSEIFDLNQPITKDTVLFARAMSDVVMPDSVGTLITGNLDVSSINFDELALAKAYLDGLREDGYTVMELSVEMADDPGADTVEQLEWVLTGARPEDADYRYLRTNLTKRVGYADGSEIQVDADPVQYLNGFVELAIPLDELNLYGSPASVMAVHHYFGYEGEYFSTFAPSPVRLYDDAEDEMSYYDAESNTLYLYTDAWCGEIGLLCVDTPVRAVGIFDEETESLYTMYYLEGSTIGDSLPTPSSPTGLNFYGWRDVFSEAMVNAQTVVTENMVLEAVWIDQNTSSGSSGSSGRSSSGRSSGGSGSGSAGAVNAGASDGSSDESGSLAPDSTLPGAGYDTGAGGSAGSGAVDAGSGSVGANAFRDVPAGSWFTNSVNYVVSKGWMNGTGSDAFSPQLSLSRGMLATVLYRMADTDDALPLGIADASVLPFGDVDANAYYAAPVAWAYLNGIVTGYDETELAPGANVTREQLAVMLQRLATYLGYDTTAAGELTFSDKSQISDYAAVAVQWAVNNGIVTGREDGSFAPKAEVTRAECAAMVERFATRLLG